MSEQFEPYKPLARPLWLLAGVLIALIIGVAIFL